ncbi:hypothetical protein, partial [Metallosphaera sp.]|uniref:beta strand repeat-containing protein n=1 Tax=Metallosphaera sp. TaxID=2020860 RepID=UPI00316FBD95
MYKPTTKKMLTVLIAVTMIFSVFAALSLVAEPGYAAPATNITLSPNTIYSSGTGTRFAVVSSSVSFPNNVPLYYEWTETGSWTSTGSYWITLSGTTIAPGTLTPSLTATSGTYYFLVSSSSDGSSGVYASNPITVSTSAPSISTIQSSGIVGSTVNVTGSGYVANSTVTIYFLFNPATATSLTSANIVASARASAKGVLSASFSVPTTQYGSYGVIAVDTNGTSTEYAYSSDVWYSSFSVLASLTVSYQSGNSIYAGQSFGVTGTGFLAAGTVAISDNDINSSGTLQTSPSTITVGSDGSFTATVLTKGATFASITPPLLATTMTATESGVTSPTAVLNITAASITVSPGTISPGGSFSVTGFNFYPGGEIASNSITIASSSYLATLSNPAVTVSSTGTFTLTVSTLTFTGTLVSDNKQTVTVPETLPSPVTVGGSSTYSAVGEINISSPQLIVSYPSGYSLTASENVTVSGINFFPGSTIAANTITVGGVAGKNAAVVVPSSGSFSTLFTVPSASELSGVPLGVTELTVTQTVPSGLSYGNTSVSVNVIYSRPTVNEMGIEVSLSSFSSATTSLPGQNVGTTVYYYLFGYPAAQKVSLFMGPVQVASSIMTDANGAYSGTFVIPALPGSTSGTPYTVQTQSAYGLQAVTPSIIYVTPIFTISGTESYFSYGFLAANNYFNITGTGYGALAPVTLSFTSSDTNLDVTFVATSVTTGVNGSFKAEAQVIDVSSTVPLATNTAVGLAVSTTSASYSISTAFYELGTPTLTLEDTTSSSSEIGTTGDSITVTIGNVVKSSIVPISYSVTGPLGKSLTGLTYSSPSGTITVTYAANGTVTETLAANITGFPGATSTFLVSIPGSTGFLLNATGGHNVSTTPGGSFVVYAVGFAKNSYVSLGATGSLTISGGSLSPTTDGGYVFSVTTGTSSAAGTYLIFGEQSMSGTVTYTTGLTSSLVVTFPATLSLTPDSGTIGSLVTLTAYGLVPDIFYNVYFGNILLTSSPVLGSSMLRSFDVPTVAPGTYNVTIVPVGSTTITASQTFTVVPSTHLTLSTDAFTAFPRQLVQFTLSGLTAPTFPTGFTVISSTYSVTVDLNGTPYETVAAYLTASGALLGSFLMPNSNPGSYYLLTLYANETASGYTTVSGSNYYATLTEPFSGSQSNYLRLVSGSGALVVNISASSIATLTVDVSNAVTTSMKVPLSELNATLVAINGTVAKLSTAFGNMTASLKVINATVSSIMNGQAVINTTLGKITTSLSSLSASIVSLSGNVAVINTTLGQVTASLKAINATVSSIMNGQAVINTTLGKITASLSSINASIVALNHNVVVINTTLGQVTASLSAINATVSNIMN